MANDLLVLNYALDKFVPVIRPEQLSHLKM